MSLPGALTGFNAALADGRLIECEQEAQLLLGDRATRKHAKDS